jgi:Domain of unknown function (DUF1707)
MITKLRLVLAQEVRMDAGSAKERLPTVTTGQRIGDAERERAATALSDHFAAGRIDREEFDVRLTAAYEARTAADLEPLFLDLPPSRGATPTSTPAGTRRTRRNFAVPVLPLVLLIAVVATVVTDGHFPYFVFPMLWFARGSRHRRGW